MEKEGYELLPYKSADLFVLDIAAISKVHADAMQRRPHRDKKKATVLSSLQFATSGAQLQYLFNGPRYIGRNPDAKMMYGTTACEAVHAETKVFFEQVLQQSKRRAAVWTDVFCLKKLLTGVLQRQTYSTQQSAVELLRTGASIVPGLPLDWNTLRIDLRSVPHDVVDTSEFPSKAKVSATHKGAKRRALR